MVKTTYSDCNSEDEDLDALDFADNVASEHDDENLDPDSESDDELDYSLSRMSITPKPAFHYPMAGDLQRRSQMPAKIRPSVSPDT